MLLFANFGRVFSFLSLCLLRTSRLLSYEPLCKDSPNIYTFLGSYHSKQSPDDALMF